MFQLQPLLRCLLSKPYVRTGSSKPPRARRRVPFAGEAICSPPAPSAGLGACQPGWKAHLLLLLPTGLVPLGHLVSARHGEGNAGLAESGTADGVSWRQFPGNCCVVGHGAENTGKEHCVLPPRRGLNLTKTEPARAGVERVVHEWQQRRVVSSIPPRPAAHLPLPGLE